LSVVTAHVERDITVIVGAGVIGLSTALHLAKESQAMKVIVVDAAPEVFAQTSRTNTGTLSFHWFEDDLRRLGEYSYGLWEELSKDQTFKKECGFRDHSVFNISQGIGNSSRKLPSWFPIQEGWRVTMEPEDGRAASMWVQQSRHLGPFIVLKRNSNPLQLGRWLHARCLEAGVEFRMNTEIEGVSLSSGRIEKVQLRQRGGRLSTIDCQNLVLAAGPWTPTLWKTLFQDSNLNMETEVEASDWIIYRDKSPPSEKDIALVILDDIVGYKLEVDGRNDQTLWISSRVDLINLPCLGQKLTPDVHNITQMMENAKNFLKLDDSDVLGSGRSCRPTISRTLPVIATVPPSRLLSGKASRGDGGGSGVYINSGHGRYGVTLGLGSGKLMAQVILGKKTDIEISPMGLPV
jgi:glycine/D-amino acid oxidase-like deaminating enzyme